MRAGEEKVFAGGIEGKTVREMASLDHHLAPTGSWVAGDHTALDGLVQRAVGKGIRDPETAIGAEGQVVGRFEREVEDVIHAALADPLNAGPRRTRGPEDAAVLQAAASYNVSKGRNLEQSLTWIDKSIAMKETFRNLFVKSQILAKMGKVAEALPVAQKALSLGQSSNDPSFAFFKDGIEKSITEYTAKVPAMPAMKGKGKKKA